MKKPPRESLDAAVGALERAVERGSATAARALLAHAARTKRKRRPKPRSARRVGVRSDPLIGKREAAAELSRTCWIGTDWDPLFADLPWAVEVLRELGPARVEALRAKRRAEDAAPKLVDE